MIVPVLAVLAVAVLLWARKRSKDRRAGIKSTAPTFTVGVPAGMLRRPGKDRL
jgi:hypothetical protein